MRKFECPNKWFDKTWADSRPSFLECFTEPSEPLQLDFSNCEWLDLQPLTDLILQIAIFANKGGKILFLFDQFSRTSIAHLRVQRFLLDTNFFQCLTSGEFGWQGNIHVLHHQKWITLDQFLLHLTTLSLPPLVLDAKSILPCTIIDVSNFPDRDSIISYCLDLKAEAIGFDKARGLRLPVPLIYQSKIFFDSVLPELIDNVRIHKKTKEKYLSFFMRLRRRQESSRSPARSGEDNWRDLSEIRRRTRHLWNYDIFEISISDMGDGIQKTWTDGWRRQALGTRKKIPRLPQDGPNRLGTRVDGPLGDYLILESVFKRNTTSLTKKERASQNLPTNLTGLHSVKHAILGSEWYVSVMSGQSSTLIRGIDPFAQGEEGPPNPVQTDRYIETNGVHYLFRFTSPHGRPLRKWQTASRLDIANSPDWWTKDYPPSLSNVHVTSNYDLAPDIPDDGYLICRPAHLITHRALYLFLSEISSRNIHLIFYDIPSHIGLSLYNMISQILYHEPITVFTPIITSTFQIRVPGTDNKKAVESFISGTNSSGRYWWQDEHSPIGNTRDIFLKCRQFDSELFWSAIMNSGNALLTEPIEWTGGLILKGGYLSLPMALQNRKIRKLIRKRFVLTLYALDATEVVPSTDYMRHISKQVKNNLVSDNGSRTAVLGDIDVTGETLNATMRGLPDSKVAIPVPIFIYPASKIFDLSSNSHLLDRSDIRLLDWISQVSPYSSAISDNTSHQTAYVRVGSTNRIRPKPNKELTRRAYQEPKEAYRLWQTLSLINLGHYSYDKHHYYVWLDLLGFITSGRPEANEMFGHFIREINKLSPDVIFYAQHEVSEVLIDQLRRYVKSSGDESFPLNQIYPIGSVSDYSERTTKTVGAASAYLYSLASSNSTAVYIDDALVTGQTIREVKSILSMFGFKNIYSFVILNRGDPNSLLQDTDPNNQTHFAWWGLSIPQTGERSSCKICQGVHSLEAITATCISESLVSIFTDWSSTWAKSDSLARFENRLEDEYFEFPERKKLGSIKKKNIFLHSARAKCTWALELMSLLHRYNYLFERDDIRSNPSSSEILAGMAFIFLNELDSTQTRKLVDELVDHFFLDERTSGRALIAVCILSLDTSLLQLAYFRFNRRIVDSGFGRIDSAALYYCLSTLVITNQKRRLMELEHLAQEIRTINSDTNTRTLDFGIIDILRHTFGYYDDYVLALQILGLPSDGVSHKYYIYEALKVLKTHIKDPLQIEAIKHNLIHIRALLEPLKKVFNRYTHIFTSANVEVELSEMFDSWDNLLDRFNGISELANEDAENLRELSVQTSNFLGDEIYEKNINVTEILTKEFVHYIPDVIERLISLITKQLRDTEIKIERPHFSIQWSDRTENKESLDSHQDLVCIDLMNLETVLHGILMDVKHPIISTLPFPIEQGTTFMRISYSIRSGTETDSKSYFYILFENQAASSEDVQARRGKWQIYDGILRDHGCETRHEYDKRTQVLKRTLIFPILRRAPRQYDEYY